jgi:3-hydroxyisobutyrate dehydrogenase-like beta-hydroxyacid dehydrogenase
MGAGIGWALRDGGHDVITSLAGRSERTARLAGQAGLRIVSSVAEALRQADVILVVTPPSAALAVAADIAAHAANQNQIVVDLNATSPATARKAAAIITAAGLDFVDGSISGAPPTVRPGATIYLSGPRAEAVAALRWTHVRPVVVGGSVGAASAVKMCTASVYKGQMALLTQAMRTAAANGVLDLVLADLGDGYGSPAAVASAAAKAERFVGEMREIASAQAAAGLTPRLFEAMADVWTEVAGTALGAGDPESVASDITAHKVVERLRQPALG